MTAPVETKTSRARLLLTPIGLMALALAAMWGIEVADSVVLDEALQPCSAEDFRFGVHWMWTTVQEPDGQWCSLEIELD